MNEVPPAAVGNRQVIRVFISSTFRDMHAERDAINRLVFPELRRRCLIRGAEFIGVDMRWGVTEDEIQREGTLAICLDEIERSRPFFVCLLAERFGSVYPPEEVSPALVEAARAVPALQSLVDQWYRLDETVVPPVYRLHRVLAPTMADEEAAAPVRFWEAHGLTGAGDSLTAREILRGVFEDGYPPTRALFYLRTAGVTRDAGFPPSLVPVFVETDEARRARLDALKARIHGASDRLVVQDYEAHYAGLCLAPALIPADLPANEQAALSAVVTPEQWSRLSERARDVLTQRGTVALSGMDALAERMVDDLWRAIEPELERPARQLDARERERAYHERFVMRHTAFFRGREAERARVVTYVADSQNREVLVVTGEPGAGKSAFMAECVRVCRERYPEALVVPHFIGAAPESASLSATLRSLCETLRREVGLEETVEADPDKLRFQLRKFLEQAGAKQPIVLFLDALNQLDPAGRSHELDWLPMWAPPGTRIVVSTLEGDLLKQLTRRVPPDHVVAIPALPRDERRALVTDFLARRRKTLTPAQLNALLDVSKRPDAGLPLYTLVALEELCLFGDHEALIRRIRLLPATLSELFDQVLARVEQDHTRATVEAVCTWLAVARAGLLESEVLDLLGTDSVFPRIRWTRLYRTLEPYLKPVDEEPGAPAAGRLDFYHDQLRSAVYRRYLHMAGPDAAATDRSSDAHRQLAVYFRAVAYDEALPNKWRSDRVRGLSELPFHQTRGEMWDGLEATLSDLDFIAAKCAAGMTFGLVTDYRLALDNLPEAQGKLNVRSENEERTARWTGELIRYSQAWSERLDLIWRAQPVDQLEPQLPEIPASRRMWTNEKIANECRRIMQTPTRLDRLTVFSGFVSAECYPLLQFGHREGFVVQHGWNHSPRGPVHDTAARMLHDCRSPVLLRRWPPSADYNPKPALLLTLAGHSRGVFSVSVTPDGRRAVSGSIDNTVRVWDLETGACLRALEGHTGLVWSVSVTPDGRRAVSGSDDKTVRVWDLETGACLRTLEGHTRVNSVNVTPDGSRAVAGNWDESLHVWDLESGVCLGTLEVHGAVVSITADGRRAVSASGLVDRTLRVWDLETGACLRTLDGHSRGIPCVIMTPDGRRAVSASYDNTLKVWDLETGACLRTLSGHSDTVGSVSMTPDGRYAVSGSNDNTLRIWELETGACLRTLVGHSQWVRSVDVTPDGRRAVSASDDTTVRVWDLESGVCLHSLTGNNDKVNSVSVTPDGRRAISGSNTLRVWDPETGECLRTLEGHTERVLGVSVTPDGRRAVTASYDNTLKVWDPETGACLRTVGPLNGPAWSVSVTSDGRRAVSGGPGTNGVWDLESGTCLRNLESRQPWVPSVSLTPDGRRAVSGSQDNTLRVWDLQSGACLHTLGHSSWPSVEYIHVSVTLGGRRAVSGSWDNCLRVWDLEIGTCLRIIEGHTGWVNSVSGTPDGRRAVSGSEDNTLRVWDLERGQCLCVCFAPAAIRSVALTSRGNTICVGTLAGEVFFLDVKGIELTTDLRSDTGDEGYEQLLLRCLEISRREKGDDEETLAHLDALAIHLQTMGKSDEARQFARERDQLTSRRAARNAGDAD